MKKIVSKRLMQCGHFWTPKRGLKTRGMCLECYRSYLNRLKNYADRDMRMEVVRGNTLLASNSYSEETRLMAFFDAVMPEIPLHKALSISREIVKNKK